MSYANQDIHNAAGPGSSAEPSMEEILASIRRILKEDEPGKPAEPAPVQAAAVAPAAAAPVDMDDDVLVLDESMIARPADLSSATMPPIELPADEHPATPLAPAGEALHFSSEPVPFARDYEPAARAMPEPVVDLPETVDDEPVPLPDTHGGASLDEDHRAEAPAEPEPETSRDWAPWPPRNIPDHDPGVADGSGDRGRLWDSLPDEHTENITADEPEPEHNPIVTAAELVTTPEPEAVAHDEPAIAEQAAPPLPPEPAYEPDDHQEPEMNDSAENAYQPPENLISDKTTDAAASSIGALVRSMTTEKSVAISKGSSITIEDIVRDEIRPLLKSWLDSNLPSLVERIVRTEIERVISRSVV